MARSRALFTVLLNALDELVQDDFQWFKAYLEDHTLLDDYGIVKSHKLRTEDKTKVLRAMMDQYGIFTITIIKRVLLEMNLHRVLQELSQFPYDPDAMITDNGRVHKSKLKIKSQVLVESVSKSKVKMMLNEGYIDLYITESDTGQVNEEHEIRQIETNTWKSTHERTIHCQDIFRGTTETGDPIRTVLTKGVAGVGKSVLTQKFTLDWAEGKANQNIQLLFPFTFRELNFKLSSTNSLMGLIHQCFIHTKALFSFQQIQLLFILDGLDECRLPLDFRRTRVISDPTESASVQELIVNLIRGDLFPFAYVWITTRPAAANQIPEECVSVVTEVRGFNDSQKDQYFMKRFGDKTTAVIKHIKRIRSLYIMCYIPIFCWILSSVLLHLMKTGENVQLPSTLTQMYIHFLVVQVKIQSKYSGRFFTDSPWTSGTRKMVSALGKLAFEQLLKGYLIFYESDLSECGLNTAEIAHSGVFSEVFREEPGQGLEKVYCFIHLSMQEFLAALHVHQTFFSSGENLLSNPLSSVSPDLDEDLLDSSDLFEDLSFEEEESLEFGEIIGAYGILGLLTTLQLILHLIWSFFHKVICVITAVLMYFDRRESEKRALPETLFYRCAVDRALESPNGHLDLFLRFLLGLSLSTNQTLLKGLVKESGSDEANHRIVKYIKNKLDKEGLSAERSLNLLYCLSELNDPDLLEQIQKVMRGDTVENYISPAQWSALSFLILSSDPDLQEFDLREYQDSESALKGLLPVIKVSTNAIMSSCNLNHYSGVHLASVLSSSNLTHLDLSYNDLCDSGVISLCEGLKSAPCRLEMLNLSCTALSSRICAALASVLTSSSLTQLDLSNNDLQDSGVEQLCVALKNRSCRLESLRLSGCLVSERGGASLAAALSSTSSALRELDLSYNHPGTSVELLTVLHLQTLRLDPAGERWMVPGLKKYACEFSLDPNTAHRSLVLSEGNRLVECVREERPYPDHEERFTDQRQVLSSSGLRGRCFWEVAWSRDWKVDVAVSYRGIRRRGAGSGFGEDDQSWCLSVRPMSCSVLHNGTERKLKFYPNTNRVAVFLDWEAGHLSFYAKPSEENLGHLHTISTSFSEPLFPGYRTDYGMAVGFRHDSE